MEHLIIGDDNIPFNLVIKTMQKSSVFEKCNDKWTDLALQLDTSPATKTQIERKLKLDNSYGTNDILIDLLMDWRSRVQKKAKLKIFTDALKHINLNDISSILVNEFSASHNNIDVSGDPTSLKKLDDRPITEEGKKLKEYVQYYIIDLIEMTELSDELLQEMIKKGVLDGKDMENINRSRFLEDKVKRFYYIILEKIGKEPEIYGNILSVFMEDEPNREKGVADIFERYFD